MTIRPIDVQVVMAQQTNVAGQEQAQQNLAPLVQSREMQKIPDKRHEQETRVDNSGESEQIKIKEKEKEQRKKGQSKSDKDKGEEEKLQKKKEDGKGERFDATT